MDSESQSNVAALHSTDNAT